MSDLKPEEQARVLIDEMLTNAGWAVVSRSEYSEAQNASAVTEALTKGNQSNRRSRGEKTKELSRQYGCRTDGRLFCGCTSVVSDLVKAPTVPFHEQW